MKILIVEDDFISRQVLMEHLSFLGRCDVAVDGEEAVQAVQLAIKNEAPYELICLDIMMPKMDGHAALKAIRESEDQAGIMLGDGAKVIMTTALKDSGNIMKAFKENCEAYLSKPISRKKLLEQLAKFRLIDHSA